MIYFDNAATTLQKPPSVVKAMESAMLECANPGRGGYKAAMKAANVVYRCREAAAQLFSVAEPERVVFTCNATHALNIAVKSLLRGGGHVVLSGYEHNAVARPVKQLEMQGVCCSVAHSPLFDPRAAYAAIAAAIREDTRCVVLSHVSNVFGFILPLEEVDRLCFEKGIPLVVDASQSAGVLELNVGKLKSAHFVCMPGHKGLYGPQGTGVLICCKEENLHSLIEGGTGSNSLELTQPDFLPDIFESGTQNVPGIAGLLEGIRFVQRKTAETIGAHERHLVQILTEGMENIGGLTVYRNAACQSGVVSFRAEGIDPDTLCRMLGEKGICLRAGLHCAPLAHQSAGTLPQGTVRISFSAFSTTREVAAFLHTLSFILHKKIG